MLTYTPKDHEITERVVEYFQLKTINLHQSETGFSTFENTADAVRWYLRQGYVKLNTALQGMIEESEDE